MPPLWDPAGHDKSLRASPSGGRTRPRAASHPRLAARPPPGPATGRTPPGGCLGRAASLSAGDLMAWLKCETCDDRAQRCDSVSSAEERAENHHRLTGHRVIVSTGRVYERKD